MKQQTDILARQDGAIPAMMYDVPQSTAAPQDAEAAPQTTQAVPQTADAAAETDTDATALTGTVESTEAPAEKELPAYGGLGIGGLIAAAVIGAAVIAALVAYLIIRGRSRRAAAIPAQPANDPSAAPAGPDAPFGIDVGNASHIGSRENQQDSFGLSNVLDPAEVAHKGALAIVADGMGGLENGADVSAIVTKTMLKSFDRLSDDADPAIRLLTMVQDANRQVNVFLKGAGGSGSTVVAALIKDNMLYTVSVGDSRIYLLRGGTLMQINREHTYGVELDEKAARGDITFEAAKSDRQRHALTSYIGMGQLAKIDRTRSPIPLSRGDRVVLMSDGVFGTLTDAEIAEALCCGAPEAAVRIERAVLEKNKPKQDNLTVVVLQIL